MSVLFYSENYVLSSKTPLREKGKMEANDYYLNLHEQPEGEHEIHVSGCLYFPLAKNAEYLGRYFYATSALAEAKRRYPSWNINGCCHCCSEIDTD
ncbi:hypothetical protein IKD57_00720 [Candidatus Saccharibacteria bacterium]|nr:hypothetical protein [Candidatus Saccharibacteria bacterium]